MRKIAVYTQTIKKSGQKIMFQLKIPANVCVVSGIIVTARFQGIAGGISSPDHCGDLRLSIPEKRNVFFAACVKRGNNRLPSYPAIKEPGITKSNQWEHQGTVRVFTALHVPVNRTLIEGYYHDQSILPKGAQYTLSIYLQTDKQ